MESVQPIDSFYKSLDAFVLASRYEGFSLSLLEAIATNLPLILTRVDGNVDLDQIGLSHLYWAPPNNSDALAGAINSWALSHPIRVNHREIACKYFRDDVTHNRI